MRQKLNTQEYTNALAARLAASAELAAALLWCAFVMRSKAEMQQSLRAAIQTARYLDAVPIQPKLDAARQVALLKRLSRTMSRFPDVNWDGVQLDARALVELLRLDSDRLPRETSTLGALFHEHVALGPPPWEVRSAPKSERPPTKKGQRRKKRSKA